MPARDDREMRGAVRMPRAAGWGANAIRRDARTPGA
jgi:hypothetical protein